jgi:ribonuclease HII
MGRPGRYCLHPTLSEEIRGWREGYRHVAGVDEAGRGPMAGPVVAGAVILDPQDARTWWSDLHDCKVLTSKQRERMAERLCEEAVCGVGVATHEEIDTVGLVPATRRAMERALAQLETKPELVLIDAVSLAVENGPQRAIIHGDALSVSIAAASVLAKVERDRLMDGHHSEYPNYGFSHNRGYCTPDHQRALLEHGPSPIHRRSFAPVRSYLEGQQGVLLE